MKNVIPIFLIFVVLVCLSSCKKTVEDVIDCIAESYLLSISDEVDDTNPKLVHFEFVNNDTDGRFTQDAQINWDFGDGQTGTSTNNKIDHTYSNTGDYTVKTSYTLRNGSSSCSGSKEKSVTIN